MSNIEATSAQKQLAQTLGFRDEELSGFIAKAASRDEAEKQCDELFEDGSDRLTLPLLQEDQQAASLKDRLDAIIKRYNERPVGGVTVRINNKDKSYTEALGFSMKLERFKDDALLKADKKKDSVTNFLREQDDAEAWLLAHDIEMEKDKLARQQKAGKQPDEQGIEVKQVTLKDLAHHEEVSCDAIDPECLKVVISRDPVDIAGMSTGRRWTSCMAKGRGNHYYVPKEIAAGTLVAYLTHKDDETLEHPLMRVLLKPFHNQAGETILVPNLIYPTRVPHNDATSRIFLHTVRGAAQEYNHGKTGNFTMDSNVYTDEQANSVTLGEAAQSEGDIAKAIAGAIPGKVEEYITEIEQAYRDDNPSIAKQYKQKLKQLYSKDINAAATNYLRDLRSVNMGQELPSPLMVKQALTSETVKDALASKEILTFLYTKGAKGWNRYMQDSHPNLTSLDLRATQIGAQGAKVLAANNTLTSLNLWGNQIGAEGAKALAANNTLTSLDLRHNKIGDQGAKALADNNTLTSLDLRYNKIGAQGAKALAGNNTLTSLDLRHNKIGDQGAEALAGNNMLTSLDLRHNKIGAEGAEALIKGLEANKNLLKYEGPGKEGLAEHIKNNRETAMHYVEQLMEQKDHASISAPDKADIVARSNAIRHVLGERDDMAAEKRLRISEMVNTIKDEQSPGSTIAEANIRPNQAVTPKSK